jgi:tyrosyl-tRNA synthetase
MGRRFCENGASGCEESSTVRVTNDDETCPDKIKTPTYVKIESMLEKSSANQRTSTSILDSFSRTADQIFSLEELRQGLYSGKKLRIKYGVDVTAPLLRIGHAVNLWMMRELQDLGHTVIFLIGDFTTRIGDPTGKAKTRPVLAHEEIEVNAKGFVEQVSRVLRTDPEVFEIRRNSEWWDAMSVDRFLSLVSMTTHAKLISRDMFQKRIVKNSEIHTHELLYPILQGYDSYELKSDLTIVGSDQLFNELLGRFYQERLGQSPQVVLTTKITPGIDGREKQSKSLGNYISIAPSPREMFGRAMNIPDTLITQYMEIYTTMLLEEISQIRRDMEQGVLNPMLAKRRLAQELVLRYYDDAAAKAEDAWFTTRSQKRASRMTYLTLLFLKALLHSKC